MLCVGLNCWWLVAGGGAQTVNMISVISILNYFLYVLQSNFIDFAIVKQFFEHTFSFIGSPFHHPTPPTHPPTTNLG